MRNLCFRPLRMFLPDPLFGQFSSEQADLDRHQKAMLSGYGAQDFQLTSLRRGARVGDGHVRMLARVAAADRKRKGHPGTGQPFLLGRIVPTEGEALTVKTFLAEIL